MISQHKYLWCTYDGELKTFSRNTVQPAEVLDWIKKENNRNEVVVCSKQLPVIHLPEENDGLLENLLPFKTLTRFKEEWVSEKKFCYFGLDSGLHQSLNRLPNPSFRHYSSVLNDFWLDTDTIFHIDFEQNFMHFFCKSAGRFLFYNRFPFENVADVHYNIAFVQKEIFSADAGQAIIFSGEISKDSAIVNGLRSYFSNIQFINELQSDFVVNNTKIDPSYFDLFAVASCVS